MDDYLARHSNQTMVGAIALGVVVILFVFWLLHGLVSLENSFPLQCAQGYHVTGYTTDQYGRNHALCAKD